MNFTKLQIHTPNRPSRLFLEQKDLNFLVIIVVLLLGSRALNSIRGQQTRQWSSVLLSIGLIAFGTHYELGQLVVSLTYGLLLSTLIRCFRSSAHLPAATYLLSFGLLTGLRLYHMDPSLNAQSNLVNLVLMMVLLRSVSLAFDLQEFGDDRRIRELSFGNIFTYLFCCFGLFTGPFYRYQVYRDWLLAFDRQTADRIEFKDKMNCEQADADPTAQTALGRQSDGTSSDRAKGPDQQCRQLIMQRVPLLLFMIAIFLIGNVFFPLNSIVIKKSGFVRLFAQSLLTFYVYRARLYVGFILSEIICILGRFGVYPSERHPKPGHGPTIFDLQPGKSKFSDNKQEIAKTEEDEQKRPNGWYSAETIKCVSSVREVELSGSVQYSLRHWNQTVQFFLQNYCYHRLKGNSDPLRMYLTLFISALWHGRYPGYFLAFVTLPILIYAEKPWQVYVKEAMGNSSPVFLAFWFFKISIVAYFGMSFYLLHLDQILLFYQATYFWGHWALLVFFAYALMMEK